MKLLIANWKSNKTNTEVAEWLSAYSTSLTLPKSGVEVVIAPSLVGVAQVSWVLHNQMRPDAQAITQVGLQDLSPFPAGSYTGAVSAYNVKELGVKYAIIGHSERRRYFHETHQDVANKVTQALENGITPIVCVDDEYIAEQAAAIEKDALSRCLVAYEELSAIGTGNNEPLDHVKEVFSRIKTVFGQVPVIYGGSVDAENVAEYLDFADGVLVGTASLQVEEFVSLIAKGANA